MTVSADAPFRHRTGCERLRRRARSNPSARLTTLYDLDGGDVKLIHYCMAGNQPTMRGTYSPETKTITFDLVSISNLKSPDDGHMPHAMYTFLDSDHFKTIWTFRKTRRTRLGRRDLRPREVVCSKQIHTAPQSQAACLPAVFCNPV